MENEKKYKIEFNKDLDLLVVKFHGKVYLGDMLDYLDELYSSKDIDLSLPMIYDFRDSLAIGYRIDVFSFIEKLTQYKSRSAKKKIGLIIQTFNHKFLGEIFIQMAKGLNLEIKMFDNYNECLEWIAEKRVKTEKSK